VTRSPLAVVLLLLLFGCAAERPPAALLPSDPAELLAAIRAREEAVRTLRARFRVEMQVDGERRSAGGVLLVAKPDRVRLRLMMPFGLTMFDLLSRDGEVRTSFPLRRDETSDSKDEIPWFAWEDVGSLFLRGANAFPGTCRPIGADERALRFLCRSAGGSAARVIEIEPREGTILREVSYEEEAARLAVDYADYRVVQDTALPFDIRLHYPMRSQSVHIVAERYEVNPELSDDLFR
jgi:outer membrane biogenesis lipoprotein LolB